LLKLAWQCQHWHALPEPGALRDQPAGLLKNMAVVSNVYEAFKSYTRATRLTTWRAENPDAWDIVGEVLKLRGKRH